MEAAFAPQLFIQFTPKAAKINGFPVCSPLRTKRDNYYYYKDMANWHGIDQVFLVKVLLVKTMKCCFLAPWPYLAIQYILNCGTS